MNKRFAGDINIAFQLAPGLNETREDALRLRTLLGEQKLARLDPLQCIDAYKNQYNSRGGVLVVQDLDGDPALQDASGSGTWVCESAPRHLPCNLDPVLDTYRANISNWRPLDAKAPILYCLSEDPPAAACKLYSSVYIMVIVIVINACKAVLMILVAWRIQINPLLTLGDAIASFLREPDRHTSAACLLSQQAIRHGKSGRLNWSNYPKKYSPRRKRIYTAASKVRWIICIIL